MKTLGTLVMTIVSMVSRFLGFDGYVIALLIFVGIDLTTWIVVNCFRRTLSLKGCIKYAARMATILFIVGIATTIDYAIWPEANATFHTAVILADMAVETQQIVKNITG